MELILTWIRNKYHTTLYVFWFYVRLFIQWSKYGTCPGYGQYRGRSNGIYIFVAPVLKAVCQIIKGPFHVDSNKWCLVSKWQDLWRCNTAANGKILYCMFFWTSFIKRPLYIWSLLLNKVALLVYSCEESARNGAIL